ncbi:tail fiber protein [Patulibacter sp. SYSU D01012]|uniref:phage tail protein n=1 Tax=Patulibacter sp. SYSU D01012 TaxID=2817381 RepID=UPI001B318489|nr:tail fiber protein [Patulibacter sp. SYSU D01012]
MAEPFLSELRLMSFNFAPKGWALCNGQLLPINQNQALFALLGTTYGGNGQTNFALPDLRGRTPVSQATDFVLGQRGGEEAHTVTVAEMPQHTHPATATSARGTQAAPGLLAGANNVYRPADALTALSPASVTSAGGGQAHENRQPYLVLTWCIALQGIFPSPN